MSTSAKVFVGSLPPGCKPEELRRLFSNYGSVTECDVMNRCAFVHLETTDMAEAAIAALNGTNFKGQSIVVEAGRPKYGSGPRNSGSGRPTEGQSGSPNKRPNDSGSNFKRGNFREEGFSGGSNSKPNQFGPMRKESNYRQQRNVPYNKGPPQQSQSSEVSSPGHQGYRNKFGDGSRSGNNRFQPREHNGGPPAGRRPNFKNSPTSQSDYHAGSSGGGGGNPRGNSAGGSGSHVRQDRRGFALPEHQHHQPQQIGFNRFGNGPMNSGNRGGGGTNGVSPHNGRGFYNGGGGFNTRRGSSGATSNEHNSPQGGGGGGGQSKRGGGGKGHNQNGLQAYQTEFPPLGSGGGQRNRFNGPRPNMGGNRRF